MAEYNISQKPKKPLAPGIKKFWAPKLQAKKLNQKSVIVALIVAGAAIIVGLVFAAIKIIGPKTLPKPAGGASTGVRAGSNRHAVPAAEYQAVKNALNAKDASLLNAYYAAKVKIVIVDLGINQTADAAQAANLVNDGLNAAQNPWNFNVPAGELAGWQNGPYGQYFSGLVTVGISANGDVISVGFDDNGQIDSVFIAPSSVLDNPTPPPSPSSAAGSAPEAPSSVNAQD